MSTQFKEFIAPFPQVETLKVDDSVYEFSDLSMTIPKITSLSGGYRSMPLNYSSILSNDNKFNVVGDFKLFENTKRYIQLKHDQYFNSDIPAEIKTERLNSLINNKDLIHLENPEKVIDQWKNLKGDIHKKYFDIIGIDPSVLWLLLETDAKEYEGALNSNIVINCFVVRYMSAMYEGMVIPQLNERDAINYIRAYQQIMPFRCCINIRDIKSIFVELDNTVMYRYCYPEFRIIGDFYRFSGDNRNNAVTRLTESDLDFSK